MGQFRNLVFEGGGVKGIAYAGAVKVLEEEGILTETTRVAGASAGAITAALVAAGADSRQLEEILANTRFTKFMDDSFGLSRDVRRLLKDFGWYKGDAFSHWMRRQLYSLIGDADITFAGLEEKAAKQGRFKELFVVGTNLSAQLESVFSAKSTPDVPIADAVRISMSIPFFFAAVRRLGDLLVDGGVTWNYPLDLFDDKSYKPAAKAGHLVNYPTRYSDTHIFNKETLGFRVDTMDEIKAEIEGWGSPPRDINNLVDYSAALVGFILDMANKSHLHKNDWHRTVFIDAGGVGTTEFHLSEKKIAMLVGNGEKGARDYFKWFNDPDLDRASPDLIRLRREPPLNRV